MSVEEELAGLSAVVLELEPALRGLQVRMAAVEQSGGDSIALNPPLALPAPLPLGAGTLLGARVGAPPAAHLLDLRNGSTEAPTKIGVSASFSRTDATTRAEVNEMGPVGTDGPDGATLLRAAIKGAPGSQVQVSAIVGSAWQTGAFGETGADACALYGLARTSAGATGRAITLYLEANREVEAGGQQCSSYA